MTQDTARVAVGRERASPNKNQPLMSCYPKSQALLLSAKPRADRNIACGAL